MNISRILRHLFTTSLKTRELFPKSTLKTIEAAIAKSEVGHSGQIQVVIETTLSPYNLFQNISSRDRALEVFSLNKVWDTEHNNGVLIYLLIADKAFEIIADRGVHQKVGDDFWYHVSALMQNELKNGAFERGLLLGISEIDKVLRQLYPASTITPNELPDLPILI